MRYTLKVPESNMRNFIALTLLCPIMIRCDITDKSSDTAEAEIGWTGSEELDGEPPASLPDGDGGAPVDPDDVDGDGIATWDDCDDTDPDSSVLATDADCDSILDTDEQGEDSPDSDGDGEPDHTDTDSDGDGIGDVFEAGDDDPDTPPIDTDGDGIPDYLDTDSDGDGFLDSDESGVDTTTDEPRDTDGDGIYDFADTDSDGDSLSDADEVGVHGTDPYDSDSDGDGFSDGGEIEAGTSPTDEESVIDGIYVEVPSRSTTTEDFEFETNIQMGDVAFLLDTTGSMSGTADAMGSEFGAIVSELSPILPDAQYGFATYDDYAYSPYGSLGEDKPFILRQQITDDISAVQSKLSSIDMHFGADGPESSMEALYQGATGNGYDQSCSGMYDGTTDVLPFLATSGDPFGGTAGESFSATSPGGGEIGGFGFRNYALPILIYATDNELRDADAGYGTPGGCPLDAGQSDVVDAINSMGGYTIGIMTSSWSSTAITQMNSLASATGSTADTDGDGIADDLLVFTWTGSDAAFRNTVTNAVADLLDSINFSKVSLEVEGDEWGFVTHIDPPYYEDVDPTAGIDVLDFTLHFMGTIPAMADDALYGFTLNVIADETVLLDTLDIIVVVPGTSS
jgi:hypothetical protein